MSMNFPNSPTNGQVHTEEGMTFVWNAAASTWIMLGGESEIADPATIVASGSGATGNWQIIGDMLICFGGTTGVTTGSRTVTFPKVFKSVPSVAMLPEAGAVGAPRFFTASSITKTEFLFQGFSDTGAQSNVGGMWIAIGEALDADKMPKIVQTVGGVTDFATEAEAIAGVATNKVMSPQLVKRVRTTKDGLPGANWQIIGNTLIQWGGGTTAGGGALTVNFPLKFKSTPRVTVTPHSDSGARRTAHIFSVTPSQVAVVCLDENNTQVVMAFHYIAIGEALDVDKLPQ